MKKEFKGIFTVMDYALSHKILLIRNTIIKDQAAYNTDIGFMAVYYLEIITTFDDLIIRKGEAEDVDRVIKRCGKDASSVTTENVFVLESGGEKYYVGAYQVDIYNNTYDPLETSIGIKRES